jgi:2-polyprenyl-3-methyl-5-hydroxy-6-metoxy-1,4-benzoquinol methylase
MTDFGEDKEWIEQPNDISDYEDGRIKVVLVKRFEYSNKPELNLNPVQQQTKQKVIEKINNKQYVFEGVKQCVICKKEDFIVLAEKDRYGFKLNTVICDNCGLVFTNPRFNEESYNKFYEEDYRDLYVGKPGRFDILFDSQYKHGKEIHEFITSHFPLPSCSVVEVGVGAGGILGYFKDKGFKVWGVDFDEDHLEYGREKGLDLFFGSIDQLVKRKTKADLVIYSHVFEHILDLKKELGKIREILNKNGYVYIEVPGIKNLDRNYELDFLKYIQNAHVYNFSLTSLTNILKQAGFELVCGNEEVKAVFKLGGRDLGENNYVKDYKEVISYLLNLERKRGLRFFNKAYLRSKASDFKRKILG